jgi:Tol biopolymer transport system component
MSLEIDRTFRVDRGEPDPVEAADDAIALRRNLGEGDLKSRLTAVAATVLCALLLVAPAYASFPGTNGKIAFQSNRGGNFQIYTMNPDGSGQTQLTQLGENFRPSWSPDGTKIAFTSTRDPGNPDCDGDLTLCNFEIYAMNADGTGQTRVTNTPLYVEDAPVWTADGTKITYHRITQCGAFGCDDSIVTTNVDGTGGHVFPTGCYASDPAWAPDGSKLAYVAFGYDFPCGDGLLTANPDGSGKQRLCCDPPAPGTQAAPDWAPDASAIALSHFVHGACPPCNGTNTIVKVPPAGGSETVLRVGAGDPGWSPDGTRIAYQDDSDGEIHVMNPDGTGDVRLTDNGSIDESPDWQPLHGPRREDFKTAAQFCKAERDFLGAGFAKQYGTNGDGANAYGKCVSQN